jgi:mannose-6-phosphate isomerase-like protein (cupin superfamily)/YHS domain-containing protein
MKGKPMTLSSVNTICPNSGKPVKNDSIADYKDMKIGFCNPGCRDNFANDPEKYPHVLGQFAPTGRLSVHDTNGFVSPKEWGKMYIANLNGIGVRVHSCSTPYKWHVNRGQEVFVVLEGEVEMRYQRDGDAYQSVTLTAGMIAHMEEGCEHVAHPNGLARVLVLEELGSA